MTFGTSTSDISRWIRERCRTLVAIGIGTTTWAMAFGTAWRLWPSSTPISAGGRISYALQLAAIPAILILLMVCSCFRLFDTAQAENPLIGAESERFKINQRVLTNTIEQGTAFIPLLLALAVRVSPEHLRLLPIAVAVWCTGRVMFWVGYHVAPQWRAPGFDWTFYTSTLLAGWYVYLRI